MRYQDVVVRRTVKALGDICRAAEAVPEDKQEWSPYGARTVLSMMEEIAISIPWFVELISTLEVPELPQHKQDRTRYGSVHECITAIKTESVALYQAIAEFPDSKLRSEVTLNFGSGTVITMADALNLCAGNVIYHHGQICYIQTMLGDYVMH